MEASVLSRRARPSARAGRRAWRRPSREALAVAPLLALVVVAFDVPVAVLLREAFGPGFDGAAFAEVARSDTYRAVLADTGRIALVVAAACLVLGLPLAAWLAQAGPRARAIGLACVVLPFAVSLLVRAYAWILLLGTEGVLNDALVGLGITGSPLTLLYRESGVVLGTVHVLLPFMVLPLYAALRRRDRRLGLAAASLGASPAMVLRRVTLPLLVPAALVGALSVFVLALGFYVTPAILGGGRVPMAATLLDLVINRLGDWGVAAAISVVLLAAAAATFALTRLLSRRAGDATSSQAVADAVTVERPPGASAWPRRAMAAYGALVSAFLVLPVLLVVPMSFSSGDTLAFPPPGLSLRWYEAFLTDEAWLRALWTSTWLALAASAIALMLGTAAAYGLARSRSRARGLLLGQFLLPIVIPEIVGAVALYIALAKLDVLGSVWGLLAAHVVLASPFVVLVMEPAVRTVDRRLEQAAWSLGSSPLRTLREVVLPLLRPSLLAAWVFAFIASFDALVVTLFVGGSTRTLPVAMLQDLRDTIDPTVTAVSTLLIAASVAAAAVVVLALRGQRRRLGLEAGA